MLSSTGSCTWTGSHPRDIMMYLFGVRLFAGTEEIDSSEQNTAPVLVPEGRGTHSSYDHTNQCINTNCGGHQELGGQSEAMRVRARAWRMKPPGPSSVFGQCRLGRGHHPLDHSTKWEEEATMRGGWRRRCCGCLPRPTPVPVRGQDTPQGLQAASPGG